jgi:hypothetical protein
LANGDIKPSSPNFIAMAFNIPFHLSHETPPSQLQRPAS